MAKVKIKKGDRVEVIAGKDRGKVGKVLRVFPSQNLLVVEKANVVKKHTRPSQKNPQGGIVEMEAPLHLSKVMLICPRCNKKTRVGKAVLADGSRVRVCKKCGSEMD